MLLSDDRRREARQRFVGHIMNLIPVMDYTSEIALKHAELLDHARRAGKPRGAHDLIIAATAVAGRRVLVTTDKNARFDDLPGVRSMLVRPE
ncbi:MAG TPA: hypothetical protein VHG10_00495 [Glycomyces sp.]|nr:hypothetical protein [Glycomyces sp.]